MPGMRLSSSRSNAAAICAPQREGEVAIICRDVQDVTVSIPESAAEDYARLLVVGSDTDGAGPASASGNGVHQPQLNESRSLAIDVMRAMAGEDDHEGKKSRLCVNTMPLLTCIYIV